MDTVSSFLFEELDICGAHVRLGSAWAEMHGGRGYGPAVRDLLGELAAVTALIGGKLKSPGRLSFHLQGHGPVRLLVVDCDEQLHLRGMAQAEDATDAAPVPVLLGDGQLVLTLQVESSRQPYQSIVPLIGDTLAAIFEHYLTQSEQAPARLWLYADDTRACGLFLQKLPDADLRDPDGWNRLQQLAATLRPDELALPAESLLTRLFGEETIRLFPSRSIVHHCPRDEEKILAMLATLGREEVEKMLTEDGEVLVRDDICNQEYRFGPEILDRLFPLHTLH